MCERGFRGFKFEMADHKPDEKDIASFSEIKRQNFGAVPADDIMKGHAKDFWLNWAQPSDHFSFHIPGK